MRTFHYLFLFSFFINNWSLANEVSPHIGTQCLMTLNTHQAVIDHFGSKLEARTNDLKRWSSLATPRADSVIERVTKHLKLIVDIEKGKDLSYSEWANWRSTSNHLLREMLDHEVEVKRAIEEVKSVISEESSIIKNATIQENASNVRNESDAAQMERKYLITRLASLIEIKKNLETSLITQYQLYFHLRNMADLLIIKLSGYLHFRTESDMKLFSFSNINQKNKSELSGEPIGENWSLRAQGNREYQVINYDSLTYKTENKLSVLNRQNLLSRFNYDESIWQNYFAAIKEYGPIAENPGSYVGSSIKLENFPSSGFPESEFKILSYDSSYHTFELSHNRGGISKVKVADLIGKQIQLKMLKDLHSSIKADRPVLLFVNSERHIVKPYIITKVSLSGESIAGVEISGNQNLSLEPESGPNWIPVTKIEGIPLSLDTNVFRWEGAGHRIDSRDFGLVLSANSITPTGEVSPLKVESNNYYGQINFYLSREESTPFRQTENWKAKDKALQVANKEIKIETYSSFIERFELVRLQIEQNGFYRERALSFMASTWEQRKLIEDNLSTVDSYLQDIENWEKPGLMARFKNEGDRRSNHNMALWRLPSELSQSRWLSEQNLDGKDQATLLVQEILETIKRYQAALPQLQQSAAVVPGLADSLTVFVKERVTLLNQLVQNIADQQRLYERSREKLTVTLKKGSDTAERLNINVTTSSTSVADGKRRPFFASGGHYAKAELTALVYAGQRGKDILQKWFTSKPNELKKEFAPSSSDFKNSKLLAQGTDKVYKVPYGKVLKSPVDVPITTPEGSFKTIRWVGTEQELPTPSERISESDFEWKVVNGNTRSELSNEQPEVFAIEFANFIEKKGALYSEALNQLIVEFNIASRQLTGITREGNIVYTRFDEAPLFFESFSEPTALTTKVNSETELHVGPFVGRGKDLQGRSYYTYRDTDIKSGHPVYKTEVIPNRVQKIQSIVKGELIPGTQLVSGMNYFLLDSAGKNAIDEAIKNHKLKMSERSNEDNPPSDTMRLNYLAVRNLENIIRMGSPTATSSEGEVYFDGNPIRKLLLHQKIQVPLQFNLTTNMAQDQLALQIFSGNSAEARSFWQNKNKALGGITSSSTFMIAPIPENIIPGGATLLYGDKPQNMYQSNSNPYFILVLNQPLD